MPPNPLNQPKSVLLLGATGTIGRAVLQQLLAEGHRVHCPLRGAVPKLGLWAQPGVTPLAQAQPLQVAKAASYDAVISCLASRTGTPKDAWAVDYATNLAYLHALQQAGQTPHFVLLSAICVQRPDLAFQQAKLAFEAQLQAAGLRWSVVRPTAFFKSLSGQWARVQAGKPFLVFGNGRLTACKPISDADLAAFITGCLAHPQRWNAVLPIGGPGPALTPLDQAQALSDALGQKVAVRHVPVALLDIIIGGLRLAGLLSPRAREKAELARIGRYYATQSMLVWDDQARAYSAQATPEFGTDTLADHYAKLAAGTAQVDLGAHAVF